MKLRDCDDLTPENRTRLLENDPNLRILQRRSLESYLVSDEVIVALIRERGARTENASREIQEARDKTILPNGSAKGALNEVYKVAKQVLENTEGIGENASQFSADVLAKLITPEMPARQELEFVLDLP